MRIVVAIDWTSQSAQALQTAIRLYSPQELIVLHAVNLGPLETYPLVPLGGGHAYDEFEKAKAAVMAKARQHLEQIASPVAASVPSLKYVCEGGLPFSLILEQAQVTMAELIVVGSCGLGQRDEIAVGSVSHKVLLYAPCSTLVVKGGPPPAQPVQRVLVAVQGPEDAERLQNWLQAYPFKQAVQLEILNVIPKQPFREIEGVPPIKSWAQTSRKAAQWIVDSMAKVLNGSNYVATGRVVEGDPAEAIAQEARGSDLIVVSSHGRKGVARFFLGSVSHTLSHKVTCPLLLVR